MSQKNFRFPPKKLKWFPFVNVLEMPEIKSLSKKSQLFLMSLIAHYYEKLRVGGKMLDLNQEENIADYKILIEWKEIEEKFSLTKPELARLEKELIAKLGNFIKIEATRIVSIDPEYYGICWDRNRELHRGPTRAVFWEEWLMTNGGKDFERYISPKYKKFCNLEKKYSFKIPFKKYGVANMPTKIFFDSELSYSEKLAIVWNLMLRSRLKRQPTLDEIEKQSGISERTIRKAKERYPFLFDKKKLYQPELL